VPASSTRARFENACAQIGAGLDYIWKQVDRGPAKDAASYYIQYIQASESGGEPPGRWWGPGAKTLGFDHGQTDRADWEQATRQQRHLAIAADAELRRRQPEQRFPPLWSP
jgi:hypothetical protein